MAGTATQCSVEIAQRDPEHIYTYFSLFYPGLGGGRFVLETGIQQTLILPPINFKAVHALNEDDVFSDTNVLTVQVNIRELDDAVRITQSAASILHRSILDAETVANRKGAYLNPSISFKFIFFVHHEDTKLTERLFGVRWYLFSKMHDWRPGNGLADNFGCIVRPIDLAFLSMNNTEGGPMENDWERRLEILQENPGFPFQIMSKQEIWDRFWSLGPLSSNGAIRQHLYRLRNYRGDEDGLTMTAPTASDALGSDIAASDGARLDDASDAEVERAGSRPASKGSSPHGLRNLGSVSPSSDPVPAQGSQCENCTHDRGKRQL